MRGPFFIGIGLFFVFICALPTMILTAINHPELHGWDFWWKGISFMLFSFLSVFEADSCGIGYMVVFYGGVGLFLFGVYAFVADRR